MCMCVCVCACVALVSGLCLTHALPRAQGYFRLKMGEGPKGLCGIASAASYAVKTSAVNKPVPTMCDMFGWTECGVGNTCSCSFSLFGWLCLW